MRRIFAAAVLTSAGCLTGGTVAHRSDAGAAAAPAPEAPRGAPAEPGRDLPRMAPVSAGEEVTVPAGPLRVGSRPGEAGRDPRHEADLVTVDVPAYRIDRLPYPNDPALPPLTGVTRAEAQARCASRGQRLCAELEWERACKGPLVVTWPGGRGFDVESCSIHPLTCASPLGVLSMGVTAMEWTSSDVSRGLGSERYSAVARGGRADESREEHRCGGRRALDPAGAQRDVGFRCCRGETADLVYPEEESLRPFQVLAVDDARMRGILATIPELSRFAADFRLVDEAGIDRVLACGGHDRGAVRWTPLEGVLRWSPSMGERAWVFAGSGGGRALVAVIYPLPDGSFVHGASFVLDDEPGPIAITWDYGSRRELLWSACWGRIGEGGAIRFRENQSIDVVQR